MLLTHAGPNRDAHANGHGPQYFLHLVTPLFCLCCRVVAEPLYPTISLFRAMTVAVNFGPEFQHVPALGEEVKPMSDVVSSACNQMTRKFVSEPVMKKSKIESVVKEIKTESVVKTVKAEYSLGQVTTESMMKTNTESMMIVKTETTSKTELTKN